jgi:DNA-binding IscR family transcriptional regulator
VSGGYQLARPRKEITFLQVIEAIDGPLEPTNCTKPESRRPGHRKGRCPAFQHFDRIKRGLVRDLGAISLGDIPYEQFYPAPNGRKAKPPKA